MNIPQRNVDTYLCHVRDGIGPITRKVINLYNKGEFGELLTTSDARSLAKQYSMDVYGLVSFGLFKVGDQYIRFRGDGMLKPALFPVNQKDSENFFRESNFPRLEMDDQEIPKNEFWYAIMGGENLEKLTQQLDDQKSKFDGVKLGSYRKNRINDSEYQKQVESLMNFCRENNFPIMIHCSQSGNDDLKGVITLAEKYPEVRICASHLGGDYYKNGDTNVNVDLKRDELLSDIPSNLFLNTAVKDHAFTQSLLRMNKHLDKHLVLASDVPFLSKSFAENFDDINTRLSEFMEQINKNGKRFLGRE